MDPVVAKQLVDKIYEKRKTAALELEKQVRECHQTANRERIDAIIDQLMEMFSNNLNPLHIRNGGLLGLAGTAIALGVDVAPYMEKFIGPLLDCFVDVENKIRYFSAECLYNIAKVSKGEVLVHFNEIFDALSKLAADSELSVKNGAELLDRLLKDIVAESAAYYVPLYPETGESKEEKYGVLATLTMDGEQEPRKAFSLARFIPLLRERIYVISPFTRSYLVSWISVLDSVPELELVTFLPEFFDGLLKYLSDPTEDVRIATENLLADFLREIRDVTYVSRHLDEHGSIRRLDDPLARNDTGESKRPGTLDSYDAAFVSSEERITPVNGVEYNFTSSPVEERNTGVWIPGQGVRIDYVAIIEILIQQLDNEHDEIQQSTALRWLAELLTWAQEVMVPFTPRLIPCILPNLAHHVSMIQTAAIKTNKLLYDVIRSLPSPTDQNLNTSTSTKEKMTTPPIQNRIPRSPTPTATASSTGGTSSGSVALAAGGVTRPGTMSKEKEKETTSSDPTSTQSPQVQTQAAPGSRPHSPVSMTSLNGQPVQQQGTEKLSGSQVLEEGGDLFDYQATVNELTVQFLSEYEETRVTALKWLIMLHQKAPKKILAMDDATFPALLKTLSDGSEEVIKQDLQLIAQISLSSEEAYFKAFMHNLLELFSTDRRLMETRGSLIIRQLCLHMNTEKIYRTLAEIIDKDEDLEFASVIVQKLNLILITSPELSDFRRRLKSVETRHDGQALFTTLYKSWCHNAVSVFSLCLMAQAYEHASNLLHIFADLEITVQMLVQIDKLVQLIESPVFTYIRLQLLEPEKYPYLFKCLYGILMLLPQSSAFVSLRNRLNAINSGGFLHIAPKSTPSVASTRSKIGREEIKWQELLMHFRSVQVKHEKARRQAMGEGSSMSMSGYSDRDLDLGNGNGNGSGSGIGGGGGSGGGGGLQSNPNQKDGTGSGGGGGGGGGIGGDRDRVGFGLGQRSAMSLGRPNMRRRGTGEMPLPPNIGLGGPLSRAGALSPLNPKARVTSGLNTGIVTSQTSGMVTSGGGGGSVLGTASGLGSKTVQRRSLDLTKKT